MNEVTKVKEINRVEAVVDEAAVRQKYRRLTQLLIEKRYSITTMESCTSGQIASLITDTEGSSAVFKGSYVSYSNEAKIKLGVPERIIDGYGVYSSETSCAMAEVCRSAFTADIGVGVSGTFGNVDINNPDSSPGEVFFSISFAGETLNFHCIVPEQPSRFDYKLYMAEIIVDRLFLLLE